MVVSLDEWVLALHVLSAFALVAGLVVFTILIVAVRRIDTPRATISLAGVAKVGNATVIAGTLGTVVFGVWLAISLEAYQVWDGWVLAAIVLWAIASGVGSLGGKEFTRGFERASELEAAGQHGPSSELLALNRTQRGLVFHTLSSLLTLLILVDMIWKPGA